MATTMINGDRRVTLPEDVSRDLGLEDGVEYIVKRSGAAIGLDRARAEQLKALEVMLASRRHFPSARVLTEDDWDRAIGKVIAEDFRSENFGNDAAVVGIRHGHYHHHTNQFREVKHGRYDH